MRKLPTRPPRFVAVDNRAVDDQRLSVLDIGLLTMALRLPDGADFTIATLAHTRKPGRQALTKAMRNLVDCGYIVKLKIQNATDGTWRTEFSVAGLPHRREDIHHLLAHVTGTRAIRVEPTWLDPRNHTPAPPHPNTPEPAPPQPDPDQPDPAPCPQPAITDATPPAPDGQNPQNPQADPSDGFPTVGQPTAGKPTTGEPAAGQPTAGNPSAKELRLHKQDRKNSSPSSPPTTPDPTPRRETTTPSGQAPSDSAPTPPAGPPPATPPPPPPRRPANANANANANGNGNGNGNGPSDARTNALAPTTTPPGSPPAAPATPHSHTPNTSGTSTPAPAGPAPSGPQAAPITPQGRRPGTAHPAAPAPAGSEPAGPQAAAAARIADDWTNARHHHGHPVPTLAPDRIAHTAEALLATGIHEQLLTQAATAMARKPTWYDLKRHLEHWTPPTRPQPTTQPRQAAHCGNCDHGWTTDPDGRARKCPCRTHQHP